jgi:hypothetical protein
MLGCGFTEMVDGWTMGMGYGGINAYERNALYFMIRVVETINFG